MTLPAAKREGEGCVKTPCGLDGWVWSMRQKFNLNFGQYDFLPVLYRCWWQQFPAHLKLPLCQGDGKNYPQSDDAQSSLHCRSSSPGCSHLKAGDCLQSDWTVKSDPCSWLCSKPVPLMPGVAGHAWLAHPWSGETRSGRWTLHWLWFSLGGRWTALTQTGENHLWNKTQQTNGRGGGCTDDTNFYLQPMLIPLSSCTNFSSHAFN